jgi:hypothetical protein
MPLVLLKCSSVSAWGMPRHIVHRGTGAPRLQWQVAAVPAQVSYLCPAFRAMAKAAGIIDGGHSFQYLIRSNPDPECTLPQVPVELEDADNLPRAFMCPITHELMRQPAVTASGASYERAAIAQWLAGTRRDPLTGRQLAPGQVGAVDWGATRARGTEDGGGFWEVQPAVRIPCTQRDSQR